MRDYLVVLAAVLLLSAGVSLLFAMYGRSARSAPPQDETNGCRDVRRDLVVLLSSAVEDRNNLIMEMLHWSESVCSTHPDCDPPAIPEWWLKDQHLPDRWVDGKL